MIEIKNQPNQLPESSLKNNAAILKMLMSSNQRDEILQIINHPIFQEKMKLLLKYYGPRGNEDSNILSNKKLLDKYPLTKALLELVGKLSNNLNISSVQTFDLIDVYFSTEHEDIQKFIKKEEIISKLGNDQSGVEFRERFQNHVHRIEEDIISMYYDERTNLLKTFFMLVQRGMFKKYLSLAYNAVDPVGEDCLKVFEKINKDNVIYKNLWEIFKSYFDHPIRKSIDDIISREHHSLQILKEQSNILDNMMILSINSKAVAGDLFIDMLKVFSSRKFMGYYYDISNDHHLEESQRSLEKFAEILIDQSVLLLLHNLDFKFLFQQDYTVTVTVNQSDKKPQISLDRMPFSIFNQIDVLSDFFDKNSRPYVMPIFMAIASVSNMIHSRKKECDPKLLDQLKKFAEKDFNNKIRDECALEFLLSMFGRPSFAESRVTFHNIYRFILKFWLNIVIKHYYDFKYPDQLVYLCAKTIDSDINRSMFWTFDNENQTPIARMFEETVRNFPNNFEMLLMLSFSLTEEKANSLFSENLFLKLSNMSNFTGECRLDDVKVINDDTGEIEVVNGFGMLHEGTHGYIISHDPKNGIIQARFEHDYTIFEFLYQKWGTLNRYLYEIPTGYQISAQEVTDKGHYVEIEFIRLFCRLISSNNRNLDLFFGSLFNNKPISEKEIVDQYIKLLAHCFETLSLLSKNWQLYSLLYPLSNSVYQMIHSFFVNKKINKMIIQILIDNFVSSFEGISGREEYAYDRNYQYYSPAIDQMRSPVTVNLIEIFGNTFAYDFNIKSLRNAILVLKLIKCMFKYPMILEFIKTTSSLEFLYNVWQYIIVEFIKTVYSTEYFNQRDEFNLCKQLVKVIYNVYKIITYTGRKAIIIESNQNILFEILVACINMVEPSEVILKLLKTRVSIHQEESNIKDKINIRNILWENYIMSGNNLYMDKLKAKGLLKSAFKCLNQIFDLVLFYKTCNDEPTMKNYYRLSTIRLWDDVFFVTKNIPVFESRSVNSNENYNINLILSIISYSDFEEKESLEFQMTEKSTMGDIFKANDDDEDASSYITYDYLISHKSHNNETNFNVSTLSLQCINRILILLQTGTLSDKQSYNLSPKVPNLLNFFQLKKQNSSELESSINLFEKFKETLCYALIRAEYPLKIAIVKFLSICAGSQMSFLILFFEDIKIKQLKTKKFWEIFAQLIKSPFNSDKDREIVVQQHYMDLLGHFAIFLGNLFSNEILFKKMIKDLLTTLKSDFVEFLNKCMERYQPNPDFLANVLSKMREYFKPNYDFNHNYDKVIQIERDSSIICFQNIVVKALSIIYAKIILLSELIEGKEHFQFTFGKELFKFLSSHVSFAVSDYKCRLNYDFINAFNDSLANDKSFHPEIRDGMSYGSRIATNYRENVINIKSSEKVIANEREWYYIPFAIDSIFSYSLNFWIDLKELYISMRVRGYSVELFIENLNNFIEYNLELSIFDSKTQLMYSISYLLGILFSMGPGNSFLSSNLFTNPKTLHIIYKSNSGRDFAYRYLSLHNNQHARLGFNPIKDLFNNSPADCLKFLEDKLLKKIELDLTLYNSSIDADLFKGKDVMMNNVTMNYMSTSPVIGKCNFYNQYLHHIYNILNYAIDYLLYLYNSNEDSKGGMLPKYILAFLKQIEKDLPLFIGNLKLFEIDKCILSLINLIYSSLTYLMLTNYDISSFEIQAINSIMENLIVCFDKLPSYQAIILFILNAYVSIDYFRKDEANMRDNLLFNSEDNAIIRMMLKKLSSNVNEQEYLAIMTLLSNLVDLYDETLDILIQEKVLLAIQLNDKFNSQSGEAITEYEDNERGVSHILWCWTLIFLRQICMKLLDLSVDNMRYYMLLHSVVDYLINHETRIFNVLENVEYVDNRGNHLHKSLAYLEELELLTSLLNAAFIQSSKWKSNTQIYIDFHNKVVNALLSKTLRLYLPNIRIVNHFKCFSNVEKMLNEITVDPSELIEKDSATSMSLKPRDENKEYTSLFSPIKISRNILSPKIGKSNLSNLSSNVSGKTYLNYSSPVCNLFLYRVDHCLNKILFNVMYIIKSAVINENISNRNSYSNFIKESYKQSNLKFFDEQCQNLGFAYYFAIHSMDNLMKNYQIFENLFQKSFIFFNNVDSSVNFGNLNLVYTEGKFEEIFHINNVTIQNLLLVNSTFYQFIQFFRNTLSYNFDTQLREVTLKKLDLILSKAKERENRIEEFGLLNGINESLIDYVKKTMKEE